MNSELDLLPVIDHLANILMVVRLKDIDVWRIRPQGALESHGLDPGWTIAFIPPLPGLGHHIDVAEYRTWFVLHECDVEHHFTSFTVARY